ncbi:type 1 glutamine amidotransferase [Rhodobacteraceae bacterium XHP0102]|nr:type 1 glutamine amidotransferase [Rhodobacteraceae bacterium XHP0102]
MIIGILQTGHMPDELKPEFSDYARLFAQLLAGHDFEFRVFNVVDMVFPDSIGDADGWLITGSRHGVYEDHPFIPPLEALIRDIHAARIPLIGVCFGHQIIAQALGGRVEKFAGGWCVGRQEYHLTDGRKLHLNAWHQDQVIAPCDGAVTLASNAFCAHAMLSYGGHTFTVQAHPEFGADVIAGLIAHRGQGIVPDPLLAQARANLGASTDNGILADQMAALFKTAKVPA